MTFKPPKAILVTFMVTALSLSNYQMEVFAQVDTLRVEALMKLSLEELLQLKVTSATRREEKILDIPATIYITDQNEMSLLGLYDLKQVLQYTPGIEYSYPHSWLQGGQRGIVGNWSKTKLLIDGMDVNLLYTGEAFIGQQFALEEVERVEVIQGPGSVTYGADAFSGIINIVTKSPSKDGLHAKAGNLSAVGGDQFFSTRTFGSISGKYNKISFNVDGGVTYMNDVNFTDFVKTPQFSQVKRNLRTQFLESGSQPYTDMNRAHNVHGKLTYKPGSGTVFTTDLLHLYDRDGGGQEYAEISFKPFRSIRQQEVISQKFDQQIGKKHVLSARLQYRYDRELNNWIYQDTVDGGNLSPVFNWNVDGSQSWYAEVFWHMKEVFQNNYTIAGIGYRSEKLAPIYYEEATFDYLEKFMNPVNKFVYLQTQQYLAKDKVYITVGLRKDFHSIYDAPFTFRGGINYKVTEKLNVKYYYGEAFRAPTLFDLELNDQLEPEHNNTHELSFSYMAGEHFYFQTTNYYSHPHNLIMSIKDPSSATQDDIFIAVNEGHREVFGNETLLKYAHYPWLVDFWVNYTRVNNQQGIAPFKSALKAGYAISNSLSVAALMKYSSPIEIQYLDENLESIYGQVPTFFNMDLTLSTGRFCLGNALGAQFSFTMQNVLNSNNYYPNLRGNDPRQFKAQGRSLWFKFSFDI